MTLQTSQKAGCADSPRQCGDLHGSILSVTGISRPTDLASLATHWSDALASWAIPQHILDAAPRDPWHLPVMRFAERADRAVSDPSGVSFERAAEALEPRGSVLDVGAGAGAASLPLVPHAEHITAVDSKAEMLDAFAHRANELGVDCALVVGRWPDVASRVSKHDVVVAHHVVFNVPDIVAFLRALDSAATRRVVLELPPHHPLTWMSPLWSTFHGIDRPTSPIAGDLVEILSALGVEDLRAEYWQLDAAEHLASDGSDDSDQEMQQQRAALVTQRLCLPASREAEVLDALRALPGEARRDLVTVSWTPSLSSSPLDETATT
jgi:SAM-dependent methyltransferase